jgi:hypothetical protein
MAGRDITDMKQTLLIFFSLLQYLEDLVKESRFQQDVQRPICFIKQCKIYEEIQVNNKLSSAWGNRFQNQRNTYKSVSGSTGIRNVWNVLT